MSIALKPKRPSRVINIVYVDPVESFESTLDITIDRFSLRSDPVYGEISEAFGYNWQVVVFPVGVDEMNEEMMGVRLVNHSSVGVRASYKISVINQLRGEDVVWEDPDGICSFAKAGSQDSAWGCDDLVELELMRDPKSGLCASDVVKITVDIRNYSSVELMNQPLALEVKKEGATESDLIDIANNDISKVVVPLKGVLAGQIEGRQDQLLASRGR